MLRIKLPVAYGSLQLDPQQHIQKRTIRMVPTPDNSECSRHAHTGQRFFGLAGAADFNDWRDVPEDIWRWKNFSPAEIACRGSGKLVVRDFRNFLIMQVCV